jgi:hypothetical protein
MNHRYYNKTTGQQLKIQLIIAATAVTVIILSVWLSVLSGVYLIPILTLAIVLSIIAPFFDTPSMKKNGRLIYYSPLFLTEKEKNGMIKMHGGTLFDYVFVIDRKLSGNQRTNFIIQQYLQGLLNLIEKYEDKNETNLKVKGTSYIMNERTARKVGFRVVETDYIQKIIMIYNYFNLLLSYSIARARLSFPNLNSIITFQASLSELMEKKKTISELNNRLKGTIADNPEVH